MMERAPEKRPMATGYFLLVLAFAGLACMSLVVGVMVQSAFRLSQEEFDRRAQAALGPLRQVIRDMAAKVQTSRQMGFDFGHDPHASSTPGIAGTIIDEMHAMEEDVKEVANKSTNALG